MSTHISFAGDGEGGSAGEACGSGAGGRAAGGAGQSC